MFWPVAEIIEGSMKLSVDKGFMTMDEAMTVIDGWKERYGARIQKAYVNETDNREGWILRTIPVR